MYKQIFTKDISKLTGDWFLDEWFWRDGWNSVRYDGEHVLEDGDFSFHYTVYFKATWTIALKLGYAPILFHDTDDNCVLRFENAADALVIKLMWEDIRDLE